MTGPQRPHEQQPQDTTIVNQLAAFLNRDSEPSGADTLEFLTLLIHGSGRPLLTVPTLDVNAEVTEDRYGLYTATVTIGGITIRVFQPVDDSADVCVDIHQEHGYGEPHRVMVTAAGRAVLNPMPLTATIPADPRLAPPGSGGHQ